MKRVISSLLVVTAVSLLVFSFSSAFFADTETSTNNTFQAGAIDLTLGHTAYYNGAPYPGPSEHPVTFSQRNLTVERFLNFTDIKPGDWGEGTIDIEVADNDAYVCTNVTLTQDDDVSCPDPELTDDPLCNALPDDLFDGDLGRSIQFLLWADDGDNVLETAETIIAQGNANDLPVLLTGALADSTTNVFSGIPGPLTGGTKYSLAKAWCFGVLSPNPVADNGGQNPSVNSGISCDGTAVNNAAQTDVVTGDISFYAIQARNNPDFSCKKLVETIVVNAADELPVISGQSLKTGQKYLIEVSGVANAGDTIDFDAKYSLTNRIAGDTWTDAVSGYESYGPTLLDLFMNTSAVSWGSFSPAHIYTTQTLGNGLPFSFVINDIYHVNNTGSLTVTIYELP